LETMVEFKGNDMMTELTTTIMKEI